MAAVGDAKEMSKPLVGTDEATVDPKGRVLLGKKKRERLGATFAMAIGELGCICVYPEDRWQARLAQMEATDPMNPARADYARLFYGTADDDLTCDVQGRVTIPGNIRESVALKEKILLVGCYDHIEIWDPQEYKKYWDDRKNYAPDRQRALLESYDAMMNK